MYSSWRLPGNGPNMLTINPSGVVTLWYLTPCFRLCPLYQYSWNLLGWHVLHYYHGTARNSRADTHRLSVPSTNPHTLGSRLPARCSASAYLSTLPVIVSTSKRSFFPHLSSSISVVALIIARRCRLLYPNVCPNEPKVST